MNHLRIGGEDRLISITYRDSVRNLSPTNIETKSKSLNVNMYPNPSSDKVKFELKSRLGKNASIEILDLQGRKVRYLPINEKSLSISVSGLARGAYLVKLNSNEGVFHGKLVVE